LARNLPDWEPGSHVVVAEPFIKTKSGDVPQMGKVYTVVKVVAGEEDNHPYVLLKEMSAVLGFGTQKFRRLKRLTPENFKTLTPEGSP
jgi:hypothetical protein